MRISVFLALGFSRVAQQVEATLSGMDSYAIAGRGDDASAILHDLEERAAKPEMMLCSCDLAGAPEMIRKLVRISRVRVVALAYSDTDQGAIDALLQAGVVHVERLPVSAYEQVPEATLKRVTHLLQLLGEVRSLKDSQPPIDVESPASSTYRPSPRAEEERALLTTSFTNDPSSLHPSAGAAIGRYDLVGVVSSTGGLHAVETVLGSLPFGFPVPVAVTQHFGEGTDREFVRLLGQKVGLAVRLVERPIKPLAGSVYVAPSGQHLAVDFRGWLTLEDEPRNAPYTPSANVLLSTMAKTYGPRCIGVVLTGMGKDGARGLLAIRESGGRTIAQDRDTSSIFGMPQAAIALEAAQEVLPVTEIGPRLRQLVRHAS